MLSVSVLELNRDTLLTESLRLFRVVAVAGETELMISPDYPLRHTEM